MLKLDHFKPSQHTNLIERISIAETGENEFNLMFIPTHYITLFIPLNEVGFYYNDKHYNKPMLQHLLLTPEYLRIPVGAKLLGVRFFLFGLYPFHAFDANNINEQMIAFNFNEEIDSLPIIEQPDEVAATVCNLLAKLYSSQREQKSKHLNDFYYYLLNSTENTSVNSFCELKNISYMTMYRSFKQLLGVSPKKVERLIKFRKSIDNIVKNNKLMNVAFDSGYYDPAHFAREFNYFVRMSPSEYISYLKKENLFDFSPFTNFSSF